MHSTGFAPQRGSPGGTQRQQITNPIAYGGNPAHLQESKKGEINDMREALTRAVNSRKEDEKTEVLTKVIQNMTLGMDVSDLFQIITMASHTRDLVQKKMIYLYLNSYAPENEMAIMAVNSMLRDTEDDSPMIRGLALRWLCSLGSPALVEHMLPPLRRGLTDVNAYVRRCATMSCAKVYRLSPIPFVDGSIANKLYQLIRDKDPHVVINSLASLEEILSTKGGVVVNQKIVLHLMTHFREFNEWGQTLILKLLQKYVPENDEELFALMNLLDSRFQHPNSGLVIAVIHLFLTYTQTKPEIYNHVYLRIKAPLLALLLRTPNEIQYASLAHILLLSQRVPTLFANEFKFFYVKVNDPDYVKLRKVAILQNLASFANFKEILTEVGCYVTDVDKELGKEAIRVIGRVAIRVPPASAQALELLLGCLELEQMAYVLETTLGVIKDMLRRYPAQAQDVIPRLAQTLDIVKDTDAVAAAIAMVGTYGETHILEDAPYLLEEIINDWDNHQAKVKNQLLVSSLKLFFKRPNEMKPVLGNLFARAADDFTNPDVHDKAIFYYRLIMKDVQTCKRVIESTKTLTEEMVVDEDAAEVDRLFEQFNTFSVVYRQSSERFIREIEQDPELDAQIKAEEDRLVQEEIDRQNLIIQQQSILQLNYNCALEPALYEQMWKTIPLEASNTIAHRPQTFDLGLLEGAFAGQGLKTVAKGGVTDVKFFLYAQQKLEHYILVQLSISSSGNMSYTLKTEANGLLAAFQRFF